MSAKKVSGFNKKSECLNEADNDHFGENDSIFSVERNEIIDRDEDFL